MRTVRRLELERYMGRWYEIARYDRPFERRLRNIEARYTLRADGNVEMERAGIDIRTVPMNDPEVMELFNSTKPLKPREDTGCELGAHALPEITPYVMQMMQTAKPKTFADLLQISGLSHGTGIRLRLLRAPQ